MDPFMGIIGAVLVGRWSLGLSMTSTRVLLDYQAPEDLLKKVTSSIEACDDSRVSDLHVWSIGPGIYAAEVALTAQSPASPSYYKSLLDNELALVHVTLEVNPAVGKEGSACR